MISESLLIISKDKTLNCGLFTNFKVLFPAESTFFSYLAYTTILKVYGTMIQSIDVQDALALIKMMVP